MNIVEWIKTHGNDASMNEDGTITVVSIETDGRDIWEVVERIPATWAAARAILGY